MSNQNTSTPMDWIQKEIDRADELFLEAEIGSGNYYGFNARGGALEAVAEVLNEEMIEWLLAELKMATENYKEARTKGDHVIEAQHCARMLAFQNVLLKIGDPIYYEDDLDDEKRQVLADLRTYLPPR